MTQQRTKLLAWILILAIYVGGTLASLSQAANVVPLGIIVLAVFVAAAWLDMKQAAAVGIVVVATDFLLLFYHENYRGSAYLLRAEVTVALVASTVGLAWLRDHREQQLVESRLASDRLERTLQFEALRSVVFEAVQDPLFVLDPEGRILDTNAAFDELVGGEHDAIVGQVPPYSWWPDAERYPRENGTVDKLWQEFLDGHQEQYQTPSYCQRQDETLIPTELTCVPFRIGDKLTLWIGTLRDVEERNRLRRREMFSESVMRTIAPTTDRPDLAQAAISSLAAEIPSDFSILYLINEYKQLECVGSVGEGIVTSAEWRTLPLDYTGPASRAARTGQQALCCTAEELAEEFPTLVDTFARDGIQSCLFVPVRHANRVIGALGMYWRQASAPTTDDILLFDDAARLVGPAADRARLFEDQQTAAQTLQAAMLPHAPADLQRVAAATRYQPALPTFEIGGDWYDVIQLASGKIGVVVGDVVGRGITAAGVMGRLRSALAVAAHASEHPSDVLKLLDSFARTIDGAAMSTCLYAVVDPEAQRLVYASAGHLPPVVIDTLGQPHIAEELRDVPLATVENANRREGFIDLKITPTVVMYTDGLVERPGSSLDAGFAQLVEVLKERADLPVEQLSDHILSGMLAGRRQQDDVALVVLRCPPITTSSFSSRSTATPPIIRDLRHQFDDWLAPLTTVDARQQVALIVSEALTNVVEHAYGSETNRPVVLEGYVADGVLTIMVADEGSWQPRTQTFERGRGILIMEALVDNVDLRRTRTGSALTMRYLLPSPETQRAHDVAHAKA